MYLCLTDQATRLLQVSMLLTFGPGKSRAACLWDRSARRRRIHLAFCGLLGFWIGKQLFICAKPSSGQTDSFLAPVTRTDDSYRWLVNPTCSLPASKDGNGIMPVGTCSWYVG
jgi:hypothetical protein